MDARNDITGCILAGGLGRRLGGADKGLVELAGRALVAHVIARFAPQVGRLMLSVNRNQPRYLEYCPQLVADSFGKAAGPLAGIAAALQCATTPWLAIAPCDCPFLPTDLVARLMAEVQARHGEIAVARTAYGRQPMFAVLTRHLAPSLEQYLATGGRKTDAWYEQHAVVEVDCTAENDAFMNINNPAELAAASLRLRPS